MQYAQFGPEGAYSSRRLGPPDLKGLQDLFVRASDYFEIATGAPPPPDEASRAFVAGPPTKSVDDKRIVGVFDADGVMVGVIDALVDWPEPAVWSIGMLLVDPTHRRRGLGTAAVTAFEGWARAEGARRLRTALVGHHAEGISFAERSGFAIDTTLADYDAGARRASVIYFDKDLTG